MISASFFTTSGRNRESFRSRLWGSGARKGQSVSRTSRSMGAYSTTSTSFLAFLKVSTPPMPKKNPMFRISLAISFG